MVGAAERSITPYREPKAILLRSDKAIRTLRLHHGEVLSLDLGENSVENHPDPGKGNADDLAAQAVSRAIYKHG